MLGIPIKSSLVVRSIVTLNILCLYCAIFVYRKTMKKKWNLLKRKKAWHFNAMQIASLMGKKRRLMCNINIKEVQFIDSDVNISSVCNNVWRICSYSKIATAHIPSNNMNVKSVNKHFFFIYFTVVRHFCDHNHLPLEFIVFVTWYWTEVLLRLQFCRKRCIWEYSITMIYS